MPAPLPLPALSAVPLEGAIETAEFRALLAKPYIPGSGELERLLNKPLAGQGDFLRLLERDVASGAIRGNPPLPPAMLANVRGLLAAGGVTLAGLIAVVGIEYLKVVARQNQAMHTNPVWVEWILDALDALATPSALPEPKRARQEAERESCDCCDKIVAIAMRHLRKVEADVKQASMTSKDSAKRYYRNTMSRRN